MARSGESNSEEKHFWRVNGIGESGLVSGEGLLWELIQGNDVPSVPLISTSDSFFPSAFMNIDTRGGVSNFGGVNQFSNTRLMNLLSRSDLSIPDRR